MEHIDVIVYITIQVEGGRDGIIKIIKEPGYITIQEQSVEHIKT